MIRTSLARLRHPVYAVLILLLLGVLGEIALRIIDSYTGQFTRADVYDQGLLCKSWVTHHALKPMETHFRNVSESQPPVELRINSFGIRHKEVTVPKPPGVYRIICLGDERTLAPDLPLEQTFSSQLQWQLENSTRQQLEVINAGVPGYCPLLSLLQVKHQLSALQPDLLVLNFEMSDIADDYRYRRLTAMSPHGLPLSCTNPELLPSPESGASRDCELLLLLQWGKQSATGMWAANIKSEDSGGIGTPAGRYAWLNNRPPDWSAHILHALEPLQQLKQLARGLYCDLLVATGPVPWQISATASCAGNYRDEIGVPPGTHCPSRLPFEILARYCREQRIAFRDTSPAFLEVQDPDRLFQPSSLGYSSAGHELYARELATAIARNAAGIWDESYTPRAERSTTTPRDGAEQQR